MLVGKIGGIRIRINLLVLLLGGLYAYLGLAVEILLILAAVLIHEIAHVIMARLLGVRVAGFDPPVPKVKKPSPRDRQITFW